MIDAEEMIGVVRAGFAPEADAAAKQRAAAALRAALAILEPATLAAGPPTTQTAPAPVDILGTLVDRFKPFLPTAATEALPRLSIPLVPVSR